MKISQLIQLLMVNVLLAALFAVVVIRIPPLPAILGAIGGGLFVYMRHRGRFLR